MAAKQNGRKKSVEWITAQADAGKQTEQVTVWPSPTKADAAKKTESVITAIIKETKRKKRMEQVAQSQTTTTDGELTHQ